MPDKKDNKLAKASKKSPSGKKKTLTVRERAEAQSAEKPKRIRKAASRVRSPLSRARKFGKQEYHMPLPDNRAGRILGKRVRIVPKFVREAFAEIKLVDWPNRRNTISLTFAVFVFAIVFALFVGALDYVLGELFKRVIIKN